MARQTTASFQGRAEPPGSVGVWANPQMEVCTAGLPKTRGVTAQAVAPTVAIHLTVERR